jgi:sugar phosphate isomerase/epimerase
MRFAVFTASTPEWTPEEAARTLAAQGWEGIEWRITDQEDAETPGFWAGNRATWPLTGLEDALPEIARITSEAGLDYSGLGGYVPASDHENVERMLAATAALGARRVRVTMPKLPVDDYRAAFAATRADLEWATGRAAAHDVQLLVELHHRTIVSSASAALRLIDGFDPARIGVIHDLGNLIYEGHEDFQAAFQLLGEYLAHVHVKNVAWRPTGETGPGGRTVWQPGWATLREGQGDIDALFRELALVKYDGWVTLEDFSTALPLAERTADNLAYVREAWQRANVAG